MAWSGRDYAFLRPCHLDSFISNLTTMNLRKFFTFGLLLVAVGTLTSCNTFLGFGRDLQQAGEGIEKTVYRR